MSRAALAVAGETCVRVPNLSVPPADVVGINGLNAFSASALFLDRARRSRAGFAPTDTDVAAIADICRHLDNIPRAIELAAARSGCVRGEGTRASCVSATTHLALLGPQTCRENSVTMPLSAPSESGR